MDNGQWLLAVQQLWFIRGFACCRPYLYPFNGSCGLVEEETGAMPSWGVAELLWLADGLGGGGLE